MKNADAAGPLERLVRTKILDAKALKVPSLARSVPKPLSIFATQNIKRIYFAK